MSSNAPATAKPKLLRVEIVDHTCEDDKAYFFDIPEETPWSRIENAVNLFYPEATSVTIGIPEEEEE